MAKNSGGTRTVANLRNPNGGSGVYDLFRIGGSKTDSGLLFFGTTFEYADNYGLHWSHEGEDTLQYAIEAKNPLVIHLDKDVKKDNVWFTEKAYKILVGGSPSSKQIENDRAIAKALQSSGYDALMYKGSDGKVLEVAILPNKLTAGKKTREPDYFSRTYGQTRSQFIDEWAQIYKDWGNKGDTRKMAIEEANKKQSEFKKKMKKK